MRKNYFLFFSLLITTAFYGQSLLTEDFNYGGTAGTIGTNSGSNVSGTAWTGKAGETYVDYVTTSLSMPGYSTGSGGSAIVTETKTDDPYSRFTEQTTGEIYYSALVNVSAVSTTAGAGGFVISLRNTGGSSYRARVIIKDDGAGGLNFGVVTATETEVYGTTSFKLNTTYLVGVYYNIASGKTDLHVLDSATNEVLALTSTGTAGQTLLAIGLRQAAGIPTANIDAIRVGNSWTDIGLPNLAQVVLSNKDFEFVDFKLFPNPTSLGYVNVSSKSDSFIKIKIFNLLGMEVMNDTISNNRINISSLNSGVYIVNIFQDDVVITKKLIVQ
jgi:hypothetical protein